MDIKLIRNYNGDKCIPVEDSMVLMVSDAGYRLNEFTGMQYMLVDVDSNAKQEIMPGTDKFDIYQFTDVTGTHDYIYFTTAVRNSSDGVTVDIIRYDIRSGEGVPIHSQNYFLSELVHKKIKVIAADEEYLIVQTQHEVSSRSDTSCTKMEDIYLYSISTGRRTQISDPVLSASGIESIMPLDGNICAIKIGISNLEYKLYGVHDDKCNEREIIGTVNFRQFLSDLVLKKEQMAIDILDENSDDTTIPHMKVMNGCVIYSKVELSSQKEEIIAFDYSGGVTRVRVNDSVRVFEEWQIYLINDTLYSLQTDDRYTRFVNLDTQKCEWKLGSEYKVIYIMNDIIVVSRHTDKKLFLKESDYILVYRFPDTDRYVLSEKACCQGCVVTTDDNLLIFCG